MPKKPQTIINETIAALFIFLFIYAGTSKLFGYQKFLVQLSQFPLITILAKWIAWIIPAIEIIISLLLMFQKTRLLGLYASFILMVMFTSYIIFILKFSDFIPCSCGGVLQKMSWNQHLIFNIVFVLLSLLGIVLHKKEGKTSYKSVEKYVT